MIDELIRKVLEIEGVEDVYRKDEVKLADGRVLVSLNIYLKAKKADPPALGVQVRDGLFADDLFGGA